MKYCARFRNSIDLTHFDEIIVELRKETFNDILGFLQYHKNQRVIFKLVDKELFLNEKLKHFLRIEQRFYFDYAFLFPDMKLFESKEAAEKDAELTEKIINKLFENDLPYYFKKIATTIDDVWYLLRLGVSDVIIGEQLGFDLDKIAPTIHSYGVQIRVFPNVCQKPYESCNDIKCFFIRAEDVDIYDKYVDVFEFWGDDKKQDVYRHIYAESKQWIGPLELYIEGFNHPIEGHHILDSFAEARSTCGRACLYGNGCRLCDVYIDLAQTLKDKGLVLVNENTNLIESTIDSQKDIEKMKKEIDKMNNKN